jgi:uncharacterized ferritin-like protein (DUF455 family)
MNWQPFVVCEPHEYAAAPRGINTLEGLGDRMRIAAFAELQAREAFLWAADTLIDANENLRETWRAIARDENRHLMMLLGRMAELGIRPDERPVSDRLWQSLRACKSSREFVAYMRTAEERARKGKKDAK